MAEKPPIARSARAVRMVPETEPKRRGVGRREVLLALPVVGVAGAAASCAADDPFFANQTDVVGASGPAVTMVSADRGVSILPDLTPAQSMATADADEVNVTYAPEVPPAADRTDQRVFEVDLEVLEGVCPLDPANGVTTLMWGYRIAGDDGVTCGTPGPILRGRVGDIARIKLTNLTGNEHPHNIDFHAVTGQGGGAADLTVAPGDSATIEARLLYPGAFMYHCAFGDVPEHIARGMYGMFIVDPEEHLPPVDHEWGLMQSEWYVGEPDPGGVAEFDRDALFAEEPRYVTFNGRTDALSGDNALTMQVGEVARFYMVNEGLNLDSNFHPIGSHWDTVYPEAATHPVNRVIRGSQSTLVVAGGGSVCELVAQVPSTIILVDHALVRTFYKGAIGQVVIEGSADPEVFVAGESEAGTAPAAPVAGEGEDVEALLAEPVDTNEVSIPDGAYDPANAATSYLPLAIRVSAGTTVTWENDDVVGHTVTSGRSNGTVGNADGQFDSGDIAAGESYSLAFPDPGEYPYFCTPHPWMKGVVVVEA